MRRSVISQWINDDTPEGYPRHDAIIRAGVLLLSTHTRSTRVRNFWYSYFTRTDEFQSNCTHTYTRTRRQVFRYSYEYWPEYWYYVIHLRLKNAILLLLECIIGRYSLSYSYSSTSTRTGTHVIFKYLYSYSYSHILQVLVLVLVLVNPVLASALVIITHWDLSRYGYPWQAIFSKAMMTSSKGNISVLLTICAGNSPVTSEFPARRPVTRSFDAFFDLHQTVE